MTSACLRCGATLTRERETTSCPECGWRPGDPAPPSRVTVGRGAFSCRSTSTSEVGSLAFEDLPARDATTLATIAAQQLDGAVRRVPTDVRSRNDPLDRVAGAFAWLLDDPDPTPRTPWALDRSDTWAAATADEVPWWAWFRDGAGLFVPLGLETSRRIDAVQALIATTIVARRDGAEVRRSADGPASSHFRRPVVAIGDAELDPVPRVQIAAHQALREGEPQDPTALARAYAPWLADGPTVAPSPTTTSVSVGRTGATTWELTVDDVTAHEREADVERFVAALAARPDVRAVVHEDRERVTVDTGDASADWLEPFARDWWRIEGT